MKRRSFLLGGAALLAGGAAALRPRDHGAPYNDYFRQLNAELKAHGPMRPSLLIDLDRLDHNIEVVKAFMVKSGKHYRIVEKSLPSAPLIEYIAQRCGTRRLMSFHQPFLNHDAQYFPDADLLLGKPLPVRSAALFYEQLKGGFDPARQLQWLLDTPQRLQQYLELAQGLNTRLRVNIEIDVGLHRGGVRDAQTLQQMLSLIAAHPQQLQFAGFMGYDPHIVAIPALVASRETLLARSLTIYQERIALVRREFPQLWQDSLTLNSAGSPTYQLHGEEQISNEVSIGTGLLKPSHYDLDTLAAHMPAVYIATPVLKATGAIELPGLDEKSRLISWWDVNQRQTYFIYGGNWMAEYEAPAGLQFNASFGHSSNQEIVNASPAAGLRVEDQVFLRPTVTEEVLLEFGDLLALRGGRIVERWPVFRG